MGKMPKFDLCHHNNNLDAPMLHRTQPCGCGFTVYLLYHTHYNFHLLLRILSDVDIKNNIIDKMHCWQTAYLENCKIEKMQV
jgi:hypothetical protein